MRRSAPVALAAFVTLIAAALGVANYRQGSNLPSPLLRKEGTVVSPPLGGGVRGGLVFAIDTSAFVSDTLLARGFSLAVTSTVPCASPRAGLVNHHALASDLLAGFFTELARCAPTATTAIILSPDHWSAAAAPLVAADVVYRTGTGTIVTDARALARLLEQVSSARQDPAPFQKEHGVGALVPFLATVAPRVSVLPVIVSGKLAPADREAFARWLREESARPGTVVVVSSDLSHYLPLQQARVNDEKTLRALADADAAFFDRATDDFTDNGKAIAAAMNALSPARFRLLAHTDSVAYGGSPGYTTTYATGLWE